MILARPRILVTNRVFPETLERLSALGTVEANPNDTRRPQHEILRRARDADAIMAFMSDCIDADFVRQCRRLRIVACALKGFDNFDIEACTRTGIWVSIVPDLLTEPTAELAIGLTIGLGRMIRDGDAIVRAGRFEGWRPILYGTGLHGATVAIIGMGRLGVAIAQRLSGFGCRLLGVDPHAAMPAGVTGCSLDAALAESDVVILAVPLTAATRHLIGRDAIAGMKRGALLINIGRGSVADENAVLAALMDGTLGGYAADVFEMEDWALPDRPRVIDRRLRMHPRTLFTPHLGSAVARVRREIELRAAENIADALAGRRPRDAVNDVKT